MSTATFKTGERLIVTRPSKVAPDHVQDFWVFDEAGYAQEDGKEIPLYGDMWKEPESFEDLDLDGMEPAFKGSVKWDGCSNWDFQPDNVLVHFCSSEDAQILADTIKVCIAKAAELIPRWQGEV